MGEEEGAVVRQIAKERKRKNTEKGETNTGHTICFELNTRILKKVKLILDTKCFELNTSAHAGPKDKTPPLIRQRQIDWRTGRRNQARPPGEP